MKRANIVKRIPLERQNSLRWALQEKNHPSIRAVALHAGVPPAKVREYLLHLIKTKQLPKTNEFYKRLKAKK